MVAIRGALIDDCALAQNLKRQGPIRLSLTDRVRSIRAYPALEDVHHMVVRSAYAQLRYSPLIFAGTVAGMALTYLAPVLLALFGPFLPAVALAYMAFTFDSAYQYARNRGGLWKGHIQANVNGV